MKTFIVEEVEYTIPDITFIGSTDEEVKKNCFVIEEGEYEGLQFRLSNFKMDDDSFLSYELEVSKEKEGLETLIENFVLYLIQNKIDKTEE